MHLDPHFLIQRSIRKINHDKMDVKDNQKLLLVGQNASMAAEMYQKTDQGAEKSLEDPINLGCFSDKLCYFSKDVIRC